MKQASLHRVAAALAFTLGVLSVVAGRQAATGWDPGYAVLGWLPLYNLVMGAWTVLVPVVLIWRGSRYAMPVSIATLALHAVVLAVLLSGALGVPATQSLLAMTFRVGVWLTVIGLLTLRSRGRAMASGAPSAGTPP